MGLLVLIALLVAAVTWGVWAHEVRRRCEVSVAAIRSSGQRVLWSEFVIQPPLPDAQNGAWYLKQAGSSLVGAPPPYPIPPAANRGQWNAAAQNSVVANTKAFELLRQARACREVQWLTTRDAMGFPAPIPQIINASSLAKLVAAKAMLHHLRGEEAEALECWKDVSGEARIIGSNNCFLISSLVCMIVDGIGVDALQQIAPTIRIGPEGGASPQAMREVIAQLEDDRDFRNIVARGFFDERCNFTNGYFMGYWGSSWLPLGPMLEQHLQRGWTILGGVAEDVRDLTRTDHQKLLTQLTEVDRLVGIVPQFVTVTDDMINAVLHRRVLAATLAIQLYRHERGCYPVSFDELVPGYLSRIPLDPRNEDKRGLGYLLVDDVRPVVYSAGTSKSAPSTKPGLLPKAWLVQGTTGTGRRVEADDVVCFDAASVSPTGNGQPHEAANPGKQEQPDRALHQ